MEEVCICNTSGCNHANRDWNKTTFKGLTTIKPNIGNKSCREELLNPIKYQKSEENLIVAQNKDDNEFNYNTEMPKQEECIDPSNTSSLCDLGAISRLMKLFTSSVSPKAAYPALNIEFFRVSWLFCFHILLTHMYMGF